MKNRDYKPKSFLFGIQAPKSKLETKGLGVIDSLYLEKTPNDAIIQNLVNGFIAYYGRGVIFRHIAGLKTGRNPEIDNHFHNLIGTYGRHNVCSNIEDMFANELKALKIARGS